MGRFYLFSANCAANIIQWEINVPIRFVCVRAYMHYIAQLSMLVKLTYQLKCSIDAICWRLKSRHPNYSINHNMFVRMAIYFSIKYKIKYKFTISTFIVTSTKKKPMKIKISSTIHCNKERSIAVEYCLKI